jgi:heme/copper-type cytochrome/quinol oxidase subunit 1
MRSAKLFAALAIFQIGLAVVERRTSSGFDIYFHATYFVVGLVYWMGFLAVTSVLFALVYFAASRWVLHPLNSSLGLTHFLFALAALLLLQIAVLTMHSPMANGLPPSRDAFRWISLELWAGPCCFLMGCATLALNCVWTGISAFRAHRYASSH